MNLVTSKTTWRGAETRLKVRPLTITDEPGLNPTEVLPLLNISASQKLQGLSSGT